MSSGELAAAMVAGSEARGASRALDALFRPRSVAVVGASQGMTPTGAPKLARHILEIHTKLTDLIELRDAAGARALMDDHVKMIRARRVAERDRGHETTCC